MKKSFAFFILLVQISLAGVSQIPVGQSYETISISGVESIDIWYYKPVNYSPDTSGIFMYFIGTGGHGSDPTNVFRDWADKYNLLIVSPHGLPGRDGRISIENETELGEDSVYIYWSPQMINDMYQNVLNRESRDTMWVYMSGFSAGGQLVTRYMLLRQAFPNPIPIRRAVSASPYGYAFCNEEHQWPLGLGLLNTFNTFFPSKYNVYFLCNEQVRNYYSENYTVMVGTADTLDGVARYQEAVDFYNFSTQDAIDRGTILKWDFVEIPNAGHSTLGVYFTKELPTDTITIAERALFHNRYQNRIKYDPPCADFSLIKSSIRCNSIYANAHCTQGKVPVDVIWEMGDETFSTKHRFVHAYRDTGTYTVKLIIRNALGSDTLTQQVTIDTEGPIVDFSVDTSQTYTETQVPFTNDCINTSYYYWNFGDSITSNENNPIHIYDTNKTFNVNLIGVAENGCANLISKNILIRPNSFEDINTYFSDNRLTIFPNPASSTLNISNYGPATSITITNILGSTTQSFSIATELDISWLSSGCYVIKLMGANNEVVGMKKFVKE